MTQNEDINSIAYSMYPTKTPPVYVPGTLLIDMILDGWSRGFDIQQTLGETRASGFIVDESLIKWVWRHAFEEMVREMDEQYIRNGGDL